MSHLPRSVAVALVLVPLVLMLSMSGRDTQLASSRGRLALARAVGVATKSQALTVDFRWSGTSRGTEAFLVVYPSTSSRSQLRQTLRLGPGGSPLALSRPVPLIALKKGSSGDYHLDSQIFSEISCGVDCAGVYPVELRIASAQTGATLGQLIMGVPFFPSGQAATIPLGVAPVLHLELAPSSKRVNAALARLSSSPTAVTISLGGSLGTSIVDQARFASLIGPPNLHQRIISPYAPPLSACGLGNFASLIGFGARLNLSRQINGAGSNAVAFSQVPGRSELSALHGQKIMTAVVPDGVLGQLASVLSVSDPAYIRIAGLTLLGSSRQLSSEFTNATAPAGYQRLLADLAQFYFQAPAQSGRVATMQVNITSPQEIDGLVTVLDRLHSTPLFRILTVDQAARLPSSQISQSDLSLASAPRHCTPMTRALRSSLDGLSGLASADRGSRTGLNDLVGLAQLASSTEPAISRQATALLGDQEHKLLAQVQIVGSRTITLTSHSVSIPLTLSSTLPFPIGVRMSIHSSEIAFPKGATRSVELRRGTATVSLPVVVKALGTFAAVVVVAAPNGRVLLTTTLTVHSTGFSTVGIVLTIGAALVLITWWVRSARRHRKKTGDTCSPE